MKPDSQKLSYVSRPPHGLLILLTTLLVLACIEFAAVLLAVGKSGRLRSDEAERRLLRDCTQTDVRRPAIQPDCLPIRYDSAQQEKV